MQLPHFPGLEFDAFLTYNGSCCFDREEALIGVHPNENTATVWLKTEDLIQIIKEHGNLVETVELQRPAGAGAFRLLLQLLDI